MIWSWSSSTPSTPAILNSQYQIIGTPSFSSAGFVQCKQNLGESKRVIEEALTHCCACRTPPVRMWADVTDAGIGIIIIKVSVLWIIVSKCILMSETTQVLVFPGVARIECNLTRLKKSNENPFVSPPAARVARQTRQTRQTIIAWWSAPSWLLVKLCPCFVLAII